jgi:hypothetical protein
VTIRRLWNFAVLVVAIEAIRAASLPMMVTEYDCPYLPGECDCGAWFTLEMTGEHIPAVIIALFAAVGCLAAFARPPAAIPRASIRNTVSFSERVCADANELIDMLGAARAGAIALGIIATAFVGALSSVCVGPGAAANSKANLLLAAVLALGCRRFRDHRAS